MVATSCSLNCAADRAGILLLSSSAKPKQTNKRISHFHSERPSAAQATTQNKTVLQALCTLTDPPLPAGLPCIRHAPLSSPSLAGCAASRCSQRLFYFPDSPYAETTSCEKYKSLRLTLQSKQKSKSHAEKRFSKVRLILNDTFISAIFLL